MKNVGDELLALEQAERRGLGLRLEHAMMRLRISGSASSRLTDVSRSRFRRLSRSVWTRLLISWYCGCRVSARVRPRRTGSSELIGELMPVPRLWCRFCCSCSSSGLCRLFPPGQSAQEPGALRGRVPGRANSRQRVARIGLKRRGQRRLALDDKRLALVQCRKRQPVIARKNVLHRAANGASPCPRGRSRPADRTAEHHCHPFLAVALAQGGSRRGWRCGSSPVPDWPPR